MITNFYKTISGLAAISFLVATSSRVFPTGTAVFGNTLFIYYGAADSQIACASVSLSELLDELMLNTRNDEK